MTRYDQDTIDPEAREWKAPTNVVITEAGREQQETRLAGFPHIDHIKGLDAQNRESIITQLQENRAEGKEKLPYERELTIEEKVVVAETIKDAQQIAVTYGAMPFEIDMESIHFVPSSYNLGRRNGEWDQQKQRIVIMLEDGATIAGNSSVLFHELIHAFFYNEATVVQENSQDLILPSRIGLDNRTERVPVGMALNEIVNEILTDQYFDTHIEPDKKISESEKQKFRKGAYSDTFRLEYAMLETHVLQRANGLDEGVLQNFTKDTFREMLIKTAATGDMTVLERTMNTLYPDDPQIMKKLLDPTAGGLGQIAREYNDPVLEISIEEVLQHDMLTR